MKTIIVPIAAVCLVALGYLVAQGSERPSTSPTGVPTANSKAAAFIGRDVKVYFRKAEDIGLEEVPNAKLGYLGGSVTDADTQLLTLRLGGGDTTWIPWSSVAYIRSGDGPATPPAAIPN